MTTQGRFSAALAAEYTQGKAAVIPDIKCISPKEGDLLRGRDPLEIAEHLVSWGAPALSVVTECEHFGGSPELLHAITKRVGVPTLRKDFIKTCEQLDETMQLGAAAVLLIVANIDADTLSLLYKHAVQIGLEPLIEVCAAEEMTLAKDLGAKLIGINNRNIMTLELDDGGVERTAKLTQLAPANALLVSESGILSAEDAKQALRAGAHAVLVGTALWQAEDMGAMYQKFQEAVCFE